MKRNVSRRELLLGGSLLLCSGCASVPGPRDRLPEANPDPAEDRRCDHDLCRYWRPEDPPGPAGERGEPRMGRCSIGLPEGM